jgi:hypothetical protein
MEEPVRWNIKVTKETDLALRTFLGSRGAKKGDLSKFIEEAVQWRVFHCKVQDIRQRNAGTDAEELQRIIDEAVREVRNAARTPVRNSVRKAARAEGRAKRRAVKA